MRSVKCVLAACLTLLIVSCGSDMQEYIITNNTKLNLLCDARIDNTSIPCGALGVGGSAGSFISRISGNTAHFLLVVNDHSQPNSNIDLDLSKIPAGVRLPASMPGLARPRRLPSQVAAGLGRSSLRRCRLPTAAPAGES